jgi:ketopantoate hydroxymethyltransferase
MKKPFADAPHMEQLKKFYKQDEKENAVEMVPVNLIEPYTISQTIKDAMAVQEAGAELLLLEAMPPQSAEQVAKQLNIPVLGIGAGHLVDGQLIIMHDLLGFYSNFRPWFAKCYVPEVIQSYKDIISSTPDLKQFGIDTKEDGLNTIVRLAIEKYISEVKLKQFPSADYNYPIKDSELENVMKSKLWVL